MDSLIEAGRKRAGSCRNSLGKRTADHFPLSTGDLAVIKPDGYVRVRDRSKDVIIF